MMEEPCAWEYVARGCEDRMESWTAAGHGLNAYLDLEKPKKTIFVQGSASSAYMNSALKYMYKETADETLLIYEHCKKAWPTLAFGQVIRKRIALKAFATDDVDVWDLSVMSSLSGDEAVRIKIDKNTRISSPKKLILSALVKQGRATKQTPLIFTEPCMNNGRVKLSTILQAARLAPTGVRKLSKKTKVSKSI